MKVALDHLLMCNTLILIEQIKNNKDDGLDDYHAVVEATVQRARPVVLTAMAAVLAFIPLTTSVFWGSMAYTLIGGTAVGTFLILLFLPALYAIWFRVVQRKKCSPTLSKRLRWRDRSRESQPKSLILKPTKGMPNVWPTRNQTKPASSFRRTRSALSKNWRRAAPDPHAYDPYAA